jgi:membrane associated rhomboid family serine protease
LSTLAIVIFVVAALFTSWFVPWYHRRDPDAVIRYVPRIAASAALLGILVLIVRLVRVYLTP